MTPSPLLPEVPRAATGTALVWRHHVHGRAIAGTFPGMQRVCFGLGCFWGAERLFWNLDGVFTTAVGFAGGHTVNPGYREVCNGGTGHAEVVQVVYDESQMTFATLLHWFWQSHDPTQGMRQGNDRGSQYRSVIYPATPAALTAAEQSRDRYQQQLSAAGYGSITTEIALGQTFYYAEEYHQQYLSKHPAGYCGLAGTGVACVLPGAAGQ